MINQATTSDIESLSLLEKSLFDSPWSDVQIRDHLHSKNLIWIDRDSSETIRGYLIVSEVLGDWEIFKVAVAPEFRRQGVASELIFHLEKCAQKGDRIFLEVRMSNISAQKLYLSCGFSECGKRKRYYRDGEDALLMMKLL